MMGGGGYECMPISQKAEKYLRYCIELLAKNDIAVVLVNAPWPEITKEAEKKYNYVQLIADEYNIPFLNGCLYVDDMELDYSMDSMGAGGHLNYSGATKYTKWLSEFLKTNYLLPDRRGEIGYELWKSESSKLKAIVRREHLKKIIDIGEYFENINSDELYYVVSISGDYYKEDGKPYLDILLEHQIDVQKRGTYIINGNTPIFYSNGECGYKYYKYFNDSVLYVYDENEKHVITWNGVVENVVQNGINIVVYDSVLDEIVGKIGYDADKRYIAVR